MKLPDFIFIVFLIFSFEVSSAFAFTHGKTHKVAPAWEDGSGDWVVIAWNLDDNASEYYPRAEIIYNVKTGEILKLRWNEPLGGSGSWYDSQSFSVVSNKPAPVDPKAPVFKPTPVPTRDWREIKKKYNLN